MPRLFIPDNNWNAITPLQAFACNGGLALASQRHFRAAWWHGTFRSLVPRFLPAAAIISSTCSVSVSARSCRGVDMPQRRHDRSAALIGLLRAAAMRVPM
jgi:hypothetical protein